MGREGAGRVTAGKAQSQENESLMTRMQEGTILSTQAQEGGTEELGEGGGSFNTQVGSKIGGVGGEVGEEAGATVKSQAKTPKIERHFHMYILQMYIDTIR